MTRSYGSFVSALVVAALLVGLTGYALSAESAVAPINAADGIGLKGYDPVAYFSEGQPTQGVEQYSLRWKGVTYRFASSENLQRFKADPDNYLPQYGGYCAYAMSLNRIADIDPSRWAVVKGKLYLNNGFISEKLWSLHKQRNIESADRNWLRFPKQALSK